MERLDDLRDLITQRGNLYLNVEINRLESDLQAVFDEAASR